MITRSQAFTVGNRSLVATLQLLGDGLHTSANGLVINGSLQGNGTTPTNDQIQVAAPLTYGGTLTVSNVRPTALAAGDSFQLFTASSYSGAFATTNLPALAAGLKWSTLLTNDTRTVMASAPRAISSVTVSGTNLVFNVTGGSPGCGYTLLTATIAALPLSRWTTNDTGNFDWLGNFTLTNAFDPATPQHCFTVRAP